MLKAFLIASIVCLFAIRANAGVVVSETETTSANGTLSVARKTVYVQGNKQKIDNPGQEVITDIDQGVIYKVDFTCKTYQVAPLPEWETQGHEPTVSLLDFPLHQTGALHHVSGNSCRDYQGASRVNQLNVKVKMCLSKDVPGHEQIAAFQRRLMARLTGSSDLSEYLDIGVPLEEEAVMRLQGSDAQGSPNILSSIRTDTRVVHIRVKDLPVGFFRPPLGFQAVNRSETDNGSQI